MLDKETNVVLRRGEDPRADFYFAIAGFFPKQVDFKGDVVARVSLSFPTSSDLVSSVARRAARILERDLTPGLRPERLSLNASLAPFAAHLERLARLDKLSSPQLNCYEAIAGVYSSLGRVFEWEKQRVREGNDGSKVEDDEAAEREVLCKQSGRPRMHAGSRVGLSLEYWMRRRLVRGRKSGDDDAAVQERDSQEEPMIWAAIIECESSPAELYPSVRVSREWVSERVERAKEPQDELFESPTDGDIIDWLEPASTYVADHSSEGMAGVGKLPDVRFVAVLEPPIIVPLRIAYEVYHTVGIQIPQESLRATTYDGLLLSPSSSSLEEDKTMTEEGGGGRKARIEREVMVFDEKGGAKKRRHTYDVYVPKQDYGRVIEEIPFSHPRQLVRILPVRLIDSDSDCDHQLTCRRFRFYDNMHFYPASSQRSLTRLGPHENQRQHYHHHPHQ